MPDKSIYDTLPCEMAEKWNNILPGLDRILFIGGRGTYNDWIASEWSRRSNVFDKKELTVTGNISDKILELRKQKDRYQWIPVEQIPFYVSSKSSGNFTPQLDLFEEMKYLILVITVRAGGNDLSDVYYLFFRNNKSNFGIQHDSSAIDTTQKSIIGTLVLNTAKEFYKTLSSYLHKLEFIRNETIKLLDFHAGRKNKTDDQLLLQWKKQWAVSYLESISSREGINYLIEPEALELLINNTYTFETIKDTLENAVKYAKALSPLSAGNNITIKNTFIAFTQAEEIVSEANAVTEKINRMDKAYQLLDKLENAAQKLIAENIKPTSELIGKAMDKQITAPAISDAVKTNKNRILRLLEKYPDKWPYIRKQFRPVLNIMPKNNYFLDKNTG